MLSVRQWPQQQQQGDDDDAPGHSGVTVAQLRGHGGGMDGGDDAELEEGEACGDDTAFVGPDVVISYIVALRCLAQLSGSTNICELFVSLVKRFDLEDGQLESDSQECKTDEPDRKDEESIVIAEELNNRRSLPLEFISTFVEVADKDLLDKLFGFIKSCLMNGSMSCHTKALLALSMIVKVNGCCSGDPGWCYFQEQCYGTLWYILNSTLLNSYYFFDFLLMVMMARPKANDVN